MRRLRHCENQNSVSEAGAIRSLNLQPGAIEGTAIFVRRLKELNLPGGHYGSDHGMCLCLEDRKAPAPQAPPSPALGLFSGRRVYNAERRQMRPTINEEERPTEDELARKNLGPRGVPGGPDTAKMTPQQEKNIPKTGKFDGHTA